MADWSAGSVNTSPSTPVAATVSGIGSTVGHRQRGATARKQPEGTAHGGESSDGESGGGAPQALPCTAPACTAAKAATCRRDAEEDGWCPRATQRVRCEHARNARLH
mmetsp:Transcript_10909/g.28699  ORF Transcript_10909/g.28699 Transcript_10909/m.28699 type:complete len:107 (-) Transcript_10909:447-767(-)